MHSHCNLRPHETQLERSNPQGKWFAHFLTLLLACGFGCPARAQVNVLTNRYDNARTGQNTSETILNPSVVNKAQFGKLFSLPVVGLVYGQPLYLSSVTIPGKGTHNLLLVVTQHDNVYAFDADSNAAPLWQITLLDAAHGAASGAGTVPNTDVVSTDIIPEIGITSTPVVDPSTGTLYVVGKTKENGGYVLRLHALDVTSGAEKFNGPTPITATVAGTGSGSSFGSLTFNTLWENQRAGLLLLNGVVYITFAAHGDLGPWHGWVFGYLASDVSQRVAVYCDSCNDSGAGIWQSGNGIASDGTFLYLATGNGPYVPTPDQSFGDSIIKLVLSGGTLSVVDYFAPFNQAALENGDLDVASGGILLLPDQSGSHPHLLVQVAKEGRIYVIDRDTMTSNNTHYCNGCTSNPEIVQEIPNAVGGMWGSPNYWNNTVYLWGKGDFLKSFALNNGLLSTTPIVSPVKANYPSPACSVSSNGVTNGILWCIVTDGSSDTGPSAPAILYAFDASNVKTELYDTTQNGSLDNPGGAVKFQVPIVVNGKVYVGAENQVSVFGLLSGLTPAATPVISPAGSSNLSQPVTVSILDSTPGNSIFYTTDNSTPTTSSTPYSNAFTVGSTTTVKAIAVASGFLQSGVASQTYAFQIAATPVISPAGSSNLTQPVSVSITDSTPGNSIFYTTDNSTPTTSSTPYLNAFSVSSTTTVKAIAVAPGFMQSTVASQTYTFQSSGGAAPLVDGQAFGDKSSGSSTVAATGFSTTSGNELILALVATDYNTGANTTVTGVAGGGLTWALAVRTNAQSGTSEIWRAFAAAPLSNVTVTATLSSSVAASIAVVSFKNVDTSGTNGSGAIGAIKSSSAGSGAPTASLVTTRNNSLVLGVGNDYDNAISRTPGPSQTVFHQYLAPVGDTYWMQIQNSSTAITGTTVNINDTAPGGDRYNLSVAEVLSSPAVVTTYTILGTVTPSASASGVTISLNGPATTTTSPDPSGNFSFPGLAPGTYTLTPSKPGFTFTPGSQSVPVTNANVTGVNFTISAASYSISGTISPLPNGSGATVQLSGPATATLTSDSSGNYSFTGLAPGTYTVTPSKSGFTFNPGSQSVSVTTTSVSAVNFTISPITYSISGTILPVPNGTGATVQLSGPATATLTSDSSGNFSFTGLAPGSYTVTPSKTGFTFAPTSQSVPVTNTNVPGVNFTISPIPTYSISGNVSPLPNGSGVTMSLTGLQTASATTDSSGNYIFAGLNNGSYTVKPSKAGLSFTPASTAVTISNASVSIVNFTAQTAVSGSLAIDANVSTDRNTSSTSLVSPIFSTAATNELLLVFVSADDNGSGTNITVSNLNGAGLTWALVVRSNAQRGTSEIWRAFAPTTLTNVTVTATLSKSVAASLTLLSFTGADPSGTSGSGAIGAVQSKGATSGAPTVSLVTTRNNSWVFGVGNDYDNAIARVPGSNQTLVHELLASVGDTYWVQRQNSPTILSGTSVTINDTSPTGDRYNLATCEVLPAP
jgi:hypothetical protein